MLNHEEHQTLEQCDRTFTKILTKADKECITISKAKWSSELNTKYLIWKFWKIAMNKHKHNKELSTAQKNIMQEVTREEIYQQDETRKTRAQYKKALNNLITTRKDSYNK